MQYNLFAQSAAGFMGSSAGSIIMIVAMLGIFYFMLIRPQNKEKKRKDEMLASMANGDTVLTTSGFYGVVIDIQEDTVIVEFGSNRNCRIPMQKAAIMAVEKPEDAIEKPETKDTKEGKETKDSKEPKTSE